MHAADAGPWAFLLTDIEGSTLIWEEDSERAARVVAQHSRIMRDIVAAYAGRVFSTAGDSFASVFVHSEAAIGAAVDAQRRLQELVPVRMAVHSGPAIERDSDFFGSTLNRAGRMRDAAHGGQIVCSQVVADAVGARLHPIELIDLGRHRLRDLGGPEHVYQVGHPALRSQFPALHTLPVSQTNLPFEATSFVGRAQETAEVDKLLHAARLVTITGAAGCGKSRLAREAAAAEADEFLHGVRLIELSSIPNPAVAISTIASALDVVGATAAEMIDAILDHLRSRELLLLIDNCEHVVAPVARLASAIITGTAGIRILATSREPLHLPGEVTFHLRPLPLPGLDDDDDTVARADSVRLFAERTAMVRPGFGLSATNLTPVASICRRLDGIPLALELAAAAARALPLHELEARLDDRFKLLRRGSKDPLAHHQTLEAAIRWSYDHLTPDQQLLFTRLGVFQGGWTLGAAEDVCGGQPFEPGEVVALLADLVDRSLVTLDDRGPKHRYNFLETVRAFARAGMENDEDLRTSHVHHFVEFAKRKDRFWLTSQHSEAISLISPELANLRAALDWSIQTSDAIAMTELFECLASYLHYRGIGAEAHGWWDRLATVPALLDPPLRARMLQTGGTMANSDGDAREALQRLEEARRLHAVTGDREREVECIYQLTETSIKLGQVDEARHYAEAGLAIDQERGGPDTVLMHRVLAVIESCSFNRDEALRHATRALEVARRRDLAVGEAWTLLAVGDIHLFLDRSVEAAQSISDEVEPLRRRLAADQMLAWHEELSARIAWFRMADQASVTALARIVGRHWARADRLRAVRALYVLGVASVALGDAGGGGRRIGAAAAHLERMGCWLPPHVLVRFVEELDHALTSMTRSERDEYDEGLHRGAGLSLREAIALAEAPED